MLLWKGHRTCDPDVAVAHAADAHHVLGSGNGSKACEDGHCSPGRPSLPRARAACEAQGPGPLAFPKTAHREWDEPGSKQACLIQSRRWKCAAICRRASARLACLPGVLAGLPDRCAPAGQSRRRLPRLAMNSRKPLVSVTLEMVAARCHAPCSRRLRWQVVPGGASTWLNQQ